jgi:hypothetical protein
MNSKEYQKKSEAAKKVAEAVSKLRKDLSQEIALTVITPVAYKTVDSEDGSMALLHIADICIVGKGIACKNRFGPCIAMSRTDMMNSAKE